MNLHNVAQLERNTLAKANITAKGGLAYAKTNATTAELVDIRSVSVNRNLPKEERISDFVKQIKNPYLFKCGKYTVKASFSENGQTLEECIKRLIK